MTPKPCRYCHDGAYPYYGGAPGRDFAGPTKREIAFTDSRGERHVIQAGSFVFAQREPSPRDTWPANFREDTEAPGLGVWYCPACFGKDRDDA